MHSQRRCADRITYNDLFPGEYFLRPMLKEYAFQPETLVHAFWNVCCFWLNRDLVL